MTQPLNQGQTTFLFFLVASQEENVVCPCFVFLQGAMA
jgi:hypothetical protein